MLKALGRFLLSALLPLGRRVAVMGNALQIVSTLLAALGLSALSLKVKGVTLWPGGVMILLLLLLGFVVVAGVRLQREGDKRAEIDFIWSMYSGPVDQTWTLDHSHKPTFQDNIAIWLSIVNVGPTARFALDLPRVRDVPENWGRGGPYRIMAPAWEHTEDPAAVEIPHGQEKRIVLANISRKPFAFWFWTTQNGKREAGSQWLIGDESQVRQVNFDVALTIMSGKRDARFMGQGRIVFASDRDPDVQLSDPKPRVS